MARAVDVEAECDALQKEISSWPEVQAALGEGHLSKQTKLMFGPGRVIFGWLKPTTSSVALTVRDKSRVVAMFGDAVSPGAKPHKVMVNLSSPTYRRSEVLAIAHFAYADAGGHAEPQSPKEPDNGRVKDAAQRPSGESPDEQPMDAEYEELITKDFDPTDVESIRMERKEQGILRRYLFGRKKTMPCAICGRALPVELLVAAHLKKRSVASQPERRDFRNIVAAMCNLGCDELYERGFIAVEGDVVVVAARAASTEALRSHLEALEGKTVFGPPGAAKYFAWHRREVFRG